MNSTIASSLNRTNGTDEEPANLHTLLGVIIFSTVYVFVLMIPTVIINAMTLYAILKDPLKCFRNPLGLFSTGVIVADLILAFIVFPFFGAADAHDLHVGMNDATYELYHIAVEVLTATIIISFLTLLGLAVSQLIAVKSPMSFDRYVTVRGVEVGLIVIWVYAAIFTAVPHFLPEHVEEVLYLWFLVVHVTIVTVALVIVYIVTYLFFSIRAANQLDEQENKLVTREFFKGTCLLSLLQILLVWPGTITLYAEEFLDQSDQEVEINVAIARYICDDILFIKFLLDPIILIWRIPKYGRAMKTVYWRIFGLEQNGNAKGRVSYNRANLSKKDGDSMDDVEVEVI